MLKETIRQLVSNGAEKMSMAMGAQPQLAGISAAELNALQGELNNKDKKSSGYAYVWS